MFTKKSSFIIDAEIPTLIVELQGALLDSNKRIKELEETIKGVIGSSRALTNLVDDQTLYLHGGMIGGGIYGWDNMVNVVGLVDKVEAVRKHLDISFNTIPATPKSIVCVKNKKEKK